MNDMIPASAVDTTLTRVGNPRHRAIRRHVDRCFVGGGKRRLPMHLATGVRGNITFT